MLTLVEITGTMVTIDTRLYNYFRYNTLKHWIGKAVHQPLVSNRAAVGTFQGDIVSWW